MERGISPIDRAVQSPMINRLQGSALMAAAAIINALAFFDKDFAPQTPDKVKAGLLGLVAIGIGKLAFIQANFLERNRNTLQNPSH